MEKKEIQEQITANQLGGMSLEEAIYQAGYSHGVEFQIKKTQAQGLRLIEEKNELPVEVVEEIKNGAQATLARASSDLKYSAGYYDGYSEGATAYATKLHQLQQENEQLKEALQEAFTTMEWMWDNMRPADEQTLLQTDVFNRPANALTIIEQAFPEVKRTKHNNTFIDGE